MARPEKTKRNRKMYRLAKSGTSIRNLARLFPNEKTGKPLNTRTVVEILERQEIKEKQSRQLSTR